MSRSSFLTFFLVCVLAVIPGIKAECNSYGVDFREGEEYFINTASTEFFDFTTLFKGCNATEDAQDGVITPILISPNDEFFCSDIPVTPNDVPQKSTCNVPGDELTKASVFSGNWIIVIEGLTFAWMRTFEIIAGIQSTVTATPTAYFTITTTPVTTVNSTVTDFYSTTVPPVTITQPSFTASVTKTVTPPKVTVTSTNSLTRTATKLKFGVTHTTKTKTAPCTTQTTKKDPPCTIFPTKATLARSVISANIAATGVARVKDRRLEPGLVRRLREERRLAAVSLAKKAPDVPTTTVTQTTHTESVNITVTAPTSTDVIPITETSTVTVTPLPVTVQSGITRTKITVTAPTPTRTIRTLTIVRTTTTKSIIATITRTSTTTPTCSRKY